MLFCVADLEPVDGGFRVYDSSPVGKYPGEKILIASVLTLIDVCSHIDNDFYSIDFLGPLDTQTSGAATSAAVAVAVAARSR